MTLETYNIKLREVAILNPENPLLPKLQGGFSAINAIYLDKIWKGLDKDLLLKSGEKNTAGEETTVKEEQDIEKATDAIFKTMLAKKYHLKGQLRATSNRFHNCKTDAERKIISIQVNDLFDASRHLQHEIDHYEKFGRLPSSFESEQKDNFFEVPDTEGEVLKQINTCHSTISGIHKDILNFPLEVRHDEKHIQYKSWKKLEARLAKWQKKLKLLQTERERYKKMRAV